MKTQRAPFTQAEYCLIPLTHRACRVNIHAAADVLKTFAAYGWKPTKHGQRSPGGLKT